MRIYASIFFFGTGCVLNAEETPAGDGDSDSAMTAFKELQAQEKAKKDELLEIQKQEQAAGVAAIAGLKAAIAAQIANIASINKTENEKLAALKAELAAAEKSTPHAPAAHAPAAHAPAARAPAHK